MLLDKFNNLKLHDLVEHQETNKKYLVLSVEQETGFVYVVEKLGLFNRDKKEKIHYCYLYPIY